MAGLTYTALSNCCNLGYIYTKPDKFENATLLYLDRPSVHTKTTFSVSKNGTFWKRSPKWINLKMPAKCVSVDSESRTFWKRWCHNSHVTLSQSLLNHWSKMAYELLIILLCLLSLWIACLEINIALYNLCAKVLHRHRNTVCLALLSNGPQQTLPHYRVRPYFERRF